VQRTLECHVDTGVTVAGDGLYSAAGEQLAALAVSDGSTAWTVELPESATSPPAIRGERLWVGGRNGALRGFE
jgi:outer membrane protein assembly factor BamB